MTDRQGKPNRGGILPSLPVDVPIEKVLRAFMQVDPEKVKGRLERQDEVDEQDS